MDGRHEYRLQRDGQALISLIVPFILLPVKEIYGAFQDSLNCQDLHSQCWNRTIYLLLQWIKLGWGSWRFHHLISYSWHEMWRDTLLRILLISWTPRQHVKWNFSLLRSNNLNNSKSRTIFSCGNSYTNLSPSYRFLWHGCYVDHINYFHASQH